MSIRRVPSESVKVIQVSAAFQARRHSEGGCCEKHLQSKSNKAGPKGSKPAAHLGQLLQGPEEA